MTQPTPKVRSDESSISRAREQRISTYKRVADRLQELDDVRTSFIDQWTPKTAREGVIAVEVEMDIGRSRPYERRYVLDTNVRSFAQRLRYTLKDAPICFYNVDQRPTKIDGDTYDERMYLITVIPNSGEKPE